MESSMYEPHVESREWARTQMTESEYPQPVKTAIERLLDVWWSQDHTAETGTATLNAFMALAQGHSLVSPTTADQVWVPLKPGNIVIRDRVRVKSDAFRGEVGQMHNGRTGVVIAIRHGDIIVKYDDGKIPPFDGVHHSPHVLEKRVR